MRLPRSLLTALLLSPLTALHAADAPKPASKPDILILLADDLGYGDPRYYNSKSEIATPHIDRLAREGMRYNLRTDPAETTNLGVKHPDKVQELLSAMQANVERGRRRW